MLYCILGYTIDENVDELIVSFLSIFFPGKPPAAIFNFSQFLADRIHHQLIKLPNEIVFQYSFVFFHMFLYFQSDKFPVNIQMLDTKGHPGSVIFWTPLIQKHSIVFSYKELIDSFVHLVVNMLSSSSQPKISDEIKRVLQLSKNCRIGYWYLYQDHTQIRIYGCHLTPYKLPKYLPMRIFALEQIRRIINLDDVNFLSARKQIQFKIKNQLGLFICNSMEAGEEAERCLQEMKFSSSFKWQYDPLRVINKLRLKFKLSPFMRESRVDIEKYANQSEWLENTLIYMEKHMDTSSILHNPALQEKNTKRTREEASCSSIDTTHDKF